MNISRKAANILKHPLRNINKILCYIRYKPQFKNYHINDSIKRPATIITPRYISLGRNVRIGKFARIQGVGQYNSRHFTPMIVLNDNVSIEQNVHITCANRVSIGENTAVAANVTITDIDHPYEDINIPVELQDIKVKEVTIGNGCKIYNGAVILPGVHIGDHCVIGANSVVNSDLPSYCVAAGAPVRIVKRFDADSKTWRRTDRNGNFI